MLSKTQIDEYLTVALRASLEAGETIKRIYQTQFDVRLKADQTPLTLADQESQATISRHLKEAGLPIVSEEGRRIPFEQRRDWNLFWMVDSLDGTKEFIKRNGEFTVNIALIQKQKPVLGVILAPDQDLLYFGAKGMGSFKAQADLFQGSLPRLFDHAVRLPLAGAQGSSMPLRARPFVVVGSRSHSDQGLQVFVEERRKEYGRVEFLSMGSSLKFGAVAEGRADVYLRLTPTMEWDTAAGQAIAENAGKRVLVWEEGLPLSYNKPSLCNPEFIVH